MSTASTATVVDDGAAARSTDWWRSAVIYQIYPRSFADANGDGIGDLPGVTAKLGELAELGVDAIWLSPFYTSPQNDAGYDVADYVDVDPVFGTLSDFDTLLETAHSFGIRVIVDLVPNHSSSEHDWFRQALLAGPGSDERRRYIFRDGLGEGGDLPPNNWQSCFGGPAWTRTVDADGAPGQWYLHLFDSTQPDFDWNNRWTRDRFVEILRFWLDRGVDGFRVDVAHGLAKADGLPDYEADPDDFFQPTPYWALDAVHEVYREWRGVLEQYGPDRILCAEAWVSPLARLAEWVRPDEMHQAFNFEFLAAGWDATRLRKLIADSIDAFGAVGAPSTWVLSNHDVVRHATRFGYENDAVLVHGIGPKTLDVLDARGGLRRARAATALMLALPGSAYLYQGEELGLPEAIDIPDESRQDPAFARTGGERYGRDGCRVPIPWEASAPAFGFSPTGRSWLPQPSTWASFAWDRQRSDAHSTLTFYREALAARRAHRLGSGEFEWDDRVSGDVLAFVVGDILVVANLGSTPVEIPTGEPVLSSADLEDGRLPGDTTIWLSVGPDALAGGREGR
nr:glycoside hydrolase family 13 protein [Agromyces albus]